MCYTVPLTMPLSPEIRFQALLKQMTMFSSPRLLYLSVLFSTPSAGDTDRESGST